MIGYVTFVGAESGVRASVALDAIDAVLEPDPAGSNQTIIVLRGGRLITIASTYDDALILITIAQEASS